MIPKNIKSLILDMDGVLWRGDSPIGDLPGIFSRIQQMGLKVSFATNNGTRTPGQYVERLESFGVHAELWQMITSALVIADMLGRKYRPGTKLFVIGEAGVREALLEKNFNLLTLENYDEAEAVVMGMDRQINFEKMTAAALLVQRSLPFYVTNTDKSFPTPKGEIPGSGAWISVITTATGIEPIIAGKPYPFLLEMARSRLGTSRKETLVVGDRLETDIAGGQAAGMPVALVLSGVSSRADGNSWKPVPDLISENLAELIC